MPFLMKRIRTSTQQATANGCVVVVWQFLDIVTAIRLETIFGGQARAGGGGGDSG